MSAEKPIELYYWPTPNGWKITIMLEELGVPYEVRYINIGKGDQFEPGFLKIAPNNRMPAIVDPDGPDGEPISVFEYTNLYALHVRFDGVEKHGKQWCRHRREGRGQPENFRISGGSCFHSAFAGEQVVVAHFEVLRDHA